MVLSVILLGSVYYVYSLSASSYRIGSQMLRAMDQARFAMDQLRRDISAAAFLASPNTQADPDVCLKPNPPLKGIVFQQMGDVANAGVGDDDNQFITPTAVTLLGAWWSPALFVVETISGADVYLTAASMPATQPEFDSIFVRNRFLRIVTQDQLEMYIQISGASYAARRITLASPVPIAIPPDRCGYYGDGNGIEVNVVGYIRYRLMADSRAGAPAGKVDLIREELTPQFNPIAGTALVVAEYVADIQFYDFVRDQDMTRRDPDLAVDPLIEDVVTGSTGRYGTNDDSTPQRLRYVTIKVTTRTEEEDPTVRFVPRANNHAALDFYQVDPTMEGAARTVTLAARVGLRSFAVRNVL